jgi:hypothetical protein
MDAYRYDYTSFIHTFDLHFTQEGSKCETGGVRCEKFKSHWRCGPTVMMSIGMLLN